VSSAPLIVHASVEHGESGWGGTATAVALAAAGTVALGIETLVITPGANDAVTTASGGYRTRTLAAAGGRAGEIYESPERIDAGARLSRAMFDAIDAEHAGRPIWLIVHSEELAVLLVLASSAPWCERPLAFSHGLVVQEHPGREELAEQQRTFFASAQLVFVASESQRALAERLYPGTRFRCLALPLCLLTDELHALRQPASRRIPGRLLAAGRAVPQKGFDILLRALALIAPERELHLELFLGHGEETVLRQCAALAAALGERARLNSWSSRETLLGEMAQASAVLVPSRFEPLGIIAAEALALRTPVIATRTGGLAEMLAPVAGAILVDPEGDDGASPQRLAAGLSAMPATPWELDGPGRLKTYSLTRFGEALNL
jgi:glycosyltransferase involved in cell wall biosynthesis